MRPLRLSLEGLHSYRDRVEIDFEHLGAFGLFGIFGPVGSGKSSILDALTLALYGIVDRVHGRSRRGIVNHHTDRLEVRLRFAVGPHRWEVQRTYRRDEAGIAQRVASRLAREVAEGFEVVAEKEREVNARITEVVGLTPEDFMRAVVLPQGRFMQFLHLKGSERRDMLQRLFRLDAWGEDLRAKLRRRQEQAALARSARRGELDGLGDASEERIDHLEQELLTRTAVLEALSARAQGAEEAFQRADALRQLASQVQALEAERRELEGRREIMAQHAQRLEAAARAAQLQGPARRLQEAQERDELAQQAAAARREELQAASAQRTSSEERYQQALAALEEQSPVLRERAAGLERLAHLVAQQEELAAAQRKAKEALSQAILEREAAHEAHASAKEAIRRAEGQVRALRKELEAQRVPARERAILAELSRCRDEIERLQREIARCGPLRLQEEGRLQQALTALQGVEDAKAAAARGRQEVEDRVGALQDQCAAQGPVETAEEALAEAARRLDVARDAAARQVEAEAELAGCQEAAERAARELTEAEALWTHARATAEALRAELARQRRQELAQELASQLHPGEACPVCGHPVSDGHAPPTAPHGEPVAGVESRLEVWFQAALERRATAAERAALADRALQNAVSRAHAAREALLAGDSVEDAERRLQEARERRQAQRQLLAELEAARQELVAARLAEERAEVPLATARAEVQGAQRALDARIAQLTELRQAEGAAWEAFERLRGSHDFLSAHTFLTVPGALRALQARDRRVEAISDELDALEDALPDLRSALEEAAQAHRAATAAVDRASEQVSDLEARTSAVQQERSGLEPSLALAASEAGQAPDQLLHQVQEHLVRLEHTQREAAQAREAALASEAHASARAAAAEATARATSDQVEAAQADLHAALARVGLPPSTQVDTLLAAGLPAAEASRLRAELQVWEERLIVTDHALRGARQALAEALSTEDAVVSEEEWAALRAAREQTRVELEQTREEVIGLRQQLEQLRHRADRHARLLAELATLDQEWMRLETLGRVLRGNRFVEYVAQDYLLDLVRIANGHLARLTHHRYALELDAEGTFQIRDADGGGALRPVTSLSGGETFVASLALALALSTQVQARSANPLEFFFLDEGFGSLDPEALDRVMGAIESLREDARMIGLISHVPGVRERVPRYLQILPPGRGSVGSQIAVQDN